jgi:protein-tyrosine kinase
VSHTHSTLAAPGVSFVPLLSGLDGSARATVELVGPAFAERLLHDLGPRITDLAEYVRNAGPGNGGTTVLLTGCDRGAGCSTVAWALARAAAESVSVLVVDGDLTGADLSAPIQPDLAWDWTDVLEGRCFVDQVLRDVPGQRLTFLPLRQPATDLDAVLTHTALPLWLARLRQEFGLILFDGGPLTESGSRWAKWVDAALLICDPSRTPVRDRAGAWDALETAGTHVLGIIETFV